VPIINTAGLVAKLGDRRRTGLPGWYGLPGTEQFGRPARSRLASVILISGAR
jgi:hypothetical protein